MRRIGPLLLAIAGLASPAAAVEEDALLWTSVSLNGPLGSGVLLTADTQARIGTGPQDFRQYLVRAGLGVSLAHHVTAHMGYAYFRTGRPGQLADEHRAWQQLSYPLLARKGFTVTGRTRLEQRFLDGAERASWRLRQQLRASAPLGNPRRPSIVVASEGFLNLNSPNGAPRSGLDRFRVQAGLSIPLGRGFSLEPAYLNQFIPRRGQDLDEHILVTGLAIRF